MDRWSVRKSPKAANGGGKIVAEARGGMCPRPLEGRAMYQRLEGGECTTGWKGDDDGVDEDGGDDDDDDGDDDGMLMMAKSINKNRDLAATRS